MSLFAVAMVFVLYVPLLSSGDVVRLTLRRTPEMISESVADMDNALKPSDFKGHDNNLHGKPGLGYYIEMGFGTPPQMVSFIYCD